MFAARINAERTTLPPAHDLDEAFVLVSRRHRVIERDPGRQSGSDLARIHGATPLLRVVMRAGASFEQLEPVAERAELHRERVGDAGLEPADTARRPAGEDRALAVRAPKRVL